MMKEFVFGVFQHINLDEFTDIETEYELNEAVIAAVKKYLEEHIKDISVTDLLIDFSKDPKFGTVLYKMSNWDKEIPEVQFFGEKAAEFFVFLVCGYAEIHMDELLGDLKTCTISVYTEKSFTLTKDELKSLINFAYGECLPEEAEDYEKEVVNSVIDRIRNEFGTGYVSSKTIEGLNSDFDGVRYGYAPENIEF